MIKVKGRLKGGVGCGAGLKGNTELGIINGGEKTFQKTSKRDKCKGRGTKQKRRERETTRLDKSRQKWWRWLCVEQRPLWRSW